MLLAGSTMPLHPSLFASELLSADPGHGHTDLQPSNGHQSWAEPHRNHRECGLQGGCGLERRRSRGASVSADISRCYHYLSMANSYRDRFCR
jgi:hypothetical protein